MIPPLIAALLALPFATPPGVVRGEEDAPDGCGARALQHLIGQPLARARPRVLRAIPRTRPVRWVGPNDAITMDYSIDRLNIHFNRKRRIVRIQCG